MIKGDVFYGGQKLGTFVVCNDEKILMELNGGRWDIQHVFREAMTKDQVFTFAPIAEDNSFEPGG
jgi:hypothetical protein